MFRLKNLFVFLFISAPALGWASDDAIPMLPRGYDSSRKEPKNIFASENGIDPTEGRWNVNSIAKTQDSKENDKQIKSQAVATK
jgi:hypothetical protein